MLLRRLTSFSLLALGTFACSAESGDGRDGSSSDGPGGPVLTETPGGTSSEDLLPARIRRLTNQEYNASVQALLQTTQSPGDDFPPDTRQHGYTVNEAQRIDPILARQLDSAAIALADEAIGRLDTLAECADPEGAGQDCARDFINWFTPRAYRRLITDEERSALVSLYDAGSEGATYADGIHLVLRGILQSPNFLYLTEIGDGSVRGTVSLTAFEMASAMAYLLTSGPPDETLLAAAESGELETAEARMTHARRLLESERGKDGVIRFVREWLGIDRIGITDKDSTVYPDYTPLQASMGQETEDFVAASIESSGASVDELLGAPWTVANADLAAMYGVSGEGRIDVPDRPGLLNQAAFLSVYAHANETAPVLRGTAIMRRVSCLEIELPTTLDVEIVPPLPDATKTTRERFSIHSQDQACAGCHDMIDPIGFSFEGLDGIGASRTMEYSNPVDSTAAVALGSDYDGSYDNSAQLAEAISESAAVRECVARQLFRATTAESEGAPLTEEAFLTQWLGMSPDDQKSIIETLIALMGTELIAYRREP